MGLWIGYDGYPTFENSLFGADKYKYSRYGIRLDRRGIFSVANGFGRNVIMFGVDMSSSAHVDNQKKYILILGDSTTQISEKKSSIDFTEHNKKFCLSLHYNGANSHLFVNGTETQKFKAKDSEIDAILLCLGNISK